MATGTPRFCLLMAFSTLVSYCAGPGIPALDGSRGAASCACVVPIVVDLLLLGFFKYANFAGSTRHATTRAGCSGTDRHRAAPRHRAAGRHLVLHVPHDHLHRGRYRGVIRPTRNFFEFSAYVSLFSQLVAGPIVRFRQIEEDLEDIGHADAHAWLRRGISFFVVGLVEKVVIADAWPRSSIRRWRAYGTLSTAGAWLAMLGYTFQLYFDFSGYSDMAVGLGLHVRAPHSAELQLAVQGARIRRTSGSAGTSRCRPACATTCTSRSAATASGERQTYRNLMLTMLIGGLWHGASWTFVVWGAYHGVLLCRLPAIRRAVGPLPRARAPSRRCSCSW